MRTETREETAEIDARIRARRIAVLVAAIEAWERRYEPDPRETLEFDIRRWCERYVDREAGQ